MRCFDCGQTYQPRHGVLQVPLDGANKLVANNFVGNATYTLPTPSVEYFECQGCGKLLLPRDTCIAIEPVIQMSWTRIIERYPFR